MPIETTKRQPKPCPPPGVYPGTPREEYFSWAAISASMLKPIAVSPLEAKIYRDDDKEKVTGAMQFGTVVHAANLEPERFNRDHKIVDEIIFAATKKKRTLGMASVAGTWDQAREEHGDLVLSNEMFQKIKRMQKSKALYKPAVELEAMDGINEVAIVWEHRRFEGIFLKCLLDRVTFAEKSVEVTDYKTTRSMDLDEFARQCWNLGYAEQLGHYVAGVKAAADLDDRFKKQNVWASILAMQNESPFDIVLLDIGEAELSVCSQRWNELMQRYLYCWSKNWWPGVGEGKRQSFNWPGWVMARYVSGER